MPTPLNRIIVFVQDVPACAAFYVNVFGFTALPSDQPAAEWVELDTGGCRLAFHKARGRKAAAKPVKKRTADPHKIVFYAEDVAAARAEAVGRGASMAQVYTFGPLVLCDGYDPEGHVFQISNRA